jgi:hypothetical protein
LKQVVNPSLRALVPPGALSFLYTPSYNKKVYDAFGKIRESSDKTAGRNDLGLPEMAAFPLLRRKVPRLTRERHSRTQRRHFEGQERRRRGRYEFSTSLTYRRSNNGRNTAHGRVINVGDAGFCAVLYDTVESGQEIIIEKCFLPFPCRRAVVRWVKGFQLDIFIAGFQCRD